MLDPGLGPHLLGFQLVLSVLSTIPYGSKGKCENTRLRSVLWFDTYLSVYDLIYASFDTYNTSQRFVKFILTFVR